MFEKPKDLLGIPTFDRIGRARARPSPGVGTCELHRNLQATRSENMSYRRMRNGFIALAVLGVVAASAAWAQAAFGCWRGC